MTDLTRSCDNYPDTGGQVEEFRNDAYGNVFYQRTRSSAGTNDVPITSVYGPDGLLMNREAVLPSVPTQNQHEEETEQTASGSDVVITSKLVRQALMNGGAWIEKLASRNYYSADSRLMVVQRYDALISSSTDVGTWEEYRYDALGRRILTRARRDLNAKPDTSDFLCFDPTGGSCGSYTERTLWDGDQILYEWRVPEGTPSGMTNGSAGYVHVEGIDQPAGLIRTDGTRVVNYTWRGLGESSVFVNGTSGDCAIFFSGCTPVNWPAKTQGSVYYTPNLVGSGPSGPYTWFGTLADNGGGSSGMLYRRNRYFDPVSGRFTQQDPIGVAGGMNLYGFANGDPVNFSDPFGLCPKDQGGDGRTRSIADCPKESAGWRRYRSGSAEAVDDPLFFLFGGLEVRGAKATATTLGAGIARGHAFVKHVLETGEFAGLGIRTRAQLGRFVDDIISKASGADVRALSRGRKAYWDAETGTVVINDARSADFGTVFRPRGGRSYFEGLR